MGKAIAKRAPWITEGSNEESFTIGVYEYKLKLNKEGNTVHKRINKIDQIDERRTDYFHLIFDNSNYNANYLRSICVSEFFAIVGRIRKDLDRKTKALEKK